MPTDTIGLNASGQIPLRSTNFTDASFTAPSLITATRPTVRFSMGPTDGVKYRGAELTFFGAGSSNDTFDYRVYTSKPLVTGPNVATPGAYQQHLFCHGTATLGTQAGVLASGGPLTTDKYADTLTVTMDTFGTAVVTAYGGLAASVYSPADDTIARLFIPEVGNACDIIVVFDMTGATSGNVMIERVV